MALRENFTHIAGDLLKVKEEIRKQLGAESDFIKQVAGDIIASPGKLLRPALTLLAFSSGNNNGGNKGKVIKAASAMELIHTATLIHDDVIDETNLRRHRMSLHAKRGDKVSVLFVDYLFSRSLYILSQHLLQQHSL